MHLSAVLLGLSAVNIVITQSIHTTSDSLHQVARQLMLQQLFVEERVRSDGGSGIKQMRFNIGGTRPYHSASHAGRSVAAIHDHANYINTLGMGEVVAVLNGVEFRTRHNDYKFVMPSKTSKDYHSTQDIPFPEVPPEVLALNGIDQQVAEMKEWFRAFINQNHTVRDYRPYFKPALCYMEGAWTFASDKLDESFESDRHQIDASSWLDLQEKIRFTSYSGGKSNLENFAYLPTTIINVTNGHPTLAQWNYRILCHPLKDDLPLNRFRVIDDLAARMMYKRDMNEHSKSRAARFQLNPFDTDHWAEGKERDGLLDKLMEQVPGIDNYPGNLTDKAFNILAHKVKSGSDGGDLVMNTANYHRWYKVTKRGAMGLQLRHRGFSDPNVFMAMTSNPRIPKVCFHECRGGGRRRRCSDHCQRWSYAIPLEIIYMTPLSKWNPLKIQYKGKHNSLLGKFVRGGGRNGQHFEHRAYNGSNDHTFYMTPSEFFHGRGAVDTDNADTSNRNVGVLNRRGNMIKAGPTGFRIMFNIGGVGLFRQRYPIMPIHGEGSSVWKEVEALKDIVLSPVTHSYLFHEPIDVSLKDTENNLESQGITPALLRLTTGRRADHSHDLEISGEEVQQLMQGKPVFTNSEEADGHSHNVKIKYQENPKGKGKFFMAMCDGRHVCEHPRLLMIVL